MGSGAWEQAWLDWARPIARIASDAPDHLSWCRSKLGDAEYPHDELVDPASDPTLRWPGYVGASWRPDHGVLFVGSVHSDFTKDGRNTGSPERLEIVRAMAQANRRWRDTPRSADEDQRYLKATRHAYGTLIPGWARDSAFGQVRVHLGEPVDAIAWTNLAHCRARPRRTNEYRLQLECSGKNGSFPIGELIAALRPVAIITSVSPVETTYARRYEFSAHDGTVRPWICAFNGATGKRHGIDSTVWTAEAAIEIRRRRAKG
jgi:hypothetical protein